MRYLWSHFWRLAMIQVAAIFLGITTAFIYHHKPDLDSCRTTVLSVLLVMLTVDVRRREGK